MSFWLIWAFLPVKLFQALVLCLLYFLNCPKGSKSYVSSKLENDSYTSETVMVVMVE